MTFHVIRHYDPSMYHHRVLVLYSAQMPRVHATVQTKSQSDYETQTDDAT